MILFFDTETTGLRPGKICQLAYIMKDNEKVEAKNFFFSVPYVEPSALVVHGFTKEKLEVLSGGKIFEDFADEIQNDFLSADVVCAHNFAFDHSFLSAEYTYLGGLFKYKESFCSMKKFTPICKLLRTSSYGYKYPKLTELCEFYDVYPYDVSKATRDIFKFDGAFHDARYDTTALYLAVSEGIKKEKDIAKFFGEKTL